MANNLFGEPEWKSLLKWHQLFSDRFSVSDNSIWGIWLNHITEADDAEERQIIERQKKWETENLAQQSQTNPEYLSDMLNDMQYQAWEISNIMHSALVVALWAKMEMELKQLVDICAKALHIKGKSSSFKEVKDFFQNNLNITLEQLQEYDKVHAVQILNNSFKHNDGCYEPDVTKPYTQIDQSLLNAWRILRDNNDIDYSALPFRVLISACNSFVNLLNQEIESQLVIFTQKDSSV